MERFVLDIGVFASRADIEIARARALENIALLDKKTLIDRLNEHVEMAYRLSMKNTPLTTINPKKRNNSSFSQSYMQITRNGRKADASHSVEEKNGQILQEEGFVNGHPRTKNQLESYRRNWGFLT